MRNPFVAILTISGAFAAASTDAKPTVRTAVVMVDKLAFGAVPKSLRVGDTIVWANRDLFRHSATAKGRFDVDLPAGARRAMRLTTAGTIAFTCKYHPGMKGVLKVSP